MQCNDKVKVGDPVIVNPNDSSITIPYRFPYLTSVDNKSPNLFSARIFKGVLYYVVVEDRRAFLIKNGVYRLDLVNTPVNLLSTSMTMIGNDLILMYNSMLYRINSEGNIINRRNIEQSSGILLSRDNNIILVTSLCNNIIIVRYNLALTNIDSTRISTDYNINLSSACLFMDMYLVTCFYIMQDKIHSLLIQVKEDYSYTIKFNNDIFYNDIFSLGNYYYILGRSQTDLYLYKYDVKNVIVTIFRRQITLSSFNSNNCFFYGGVVDNRIYISYNNFINEIPTSTVSMFTKNLNFLWSINLYNSAVNTNGKTVAISNNNVYVSIAKWGNVTYNKNLILGNFLTFNLELPKLIGICVKKEGNIAYVNFRDPDCFGITLTPGLQYYVDDLGNITTNNMHRYLGTAISGTKMLIN